MEAVTQLQNFVRVAAGLMTTTLDQVQNEAPNIDVGQELTVEHAVKAEEQARKLFHLLQTGLGARRALPGARSSLLTPQLTG